MTTYESATKDLVAAVDAVVEEWLTALAVGTMQRLGGVPSETFREHARVAATEGAAETMRRLRDALSIDVDSQRVNPLQILRDAVRFPTAVLNEAGVVAPERDEFDQRINPDDVYGICPAHWNDIHDSLTEPGIVWGAAKASTVLQRRRAEGKLD